METMINEKTVAAMAAQFSALSELVPLRPIHDQAGYDHAVAILNQLLDAGAADEAHPLADLADTLGALIGEYDQTHHAIADATPVAVLRYLMDEHQLSQSDLPEIGSQGVVSEILSGKRELNVRQVKALSARFAIGPAAFI